MAVVIPAYNEEKYLGATIDSIETSVRKLPSNWVAELIVVDDASSDDTAIIARTRNVRVVMGQHRGIGAARNTGASSASAELLVFIDADTIIPEDTLRAVSNLFEQFGKLAVCVPSEYETRRWLLKPLLAWWRWYAPRHNSTQGVFQAFEKEIFQSLGGYSERLHMAEDTDLFDRAIENLKPDQWEIVATFTVRASMRRYEQQSIVTIWLLTNPLSTRLLRRLEPIWRSWRIDPPR